MSDIFVSYASDDKSRIAPLVNALTAQGWDVWWDREIPPGRTFDEVIEEALEAARCVIVVWSKASVKSRWVKAEATEGDRRGILVPIQIDTVSIPLSFRQIQAAQLIDWDGSSDNPEYLRLQNSIITLLGPSIILSSTVREDLSEHAEESPRRVVSESAEAIDLLSPKSSFTIDIVLGLVVGILMIVAIATIRQGWISERDIWLLVPTFWIPVLSAIPLSIILVRRIRNRRSK